jgi:hypothetical protein
MARLKKKFSPVSKRRLTCNADLVRDLITFSDYGAIGELFVVMGIRAYADQIIKRGAPDKTEDFGFITQERWLEVARDVKKRCDDFYDRHKRADDDGPIPADTEDGDLRLVG